VGNYVTGNVCDCKNECDTKGIHLNVDDDGIGDIANNVDADDGSNSVIRCRTLTTFYRLMRVISMMI